MLAQLPAGHVGGYDAAGVVVRPAADGTGPAEGTRVLAFGPGAWAELLAVSSADVAPLPRGAALAEAAAWALLAPGATLQSIGWAGGEPAVFPPGSTFFPGAARTLSSFGDAAAVGADLGLLAVLLASGALSAQVGWRGSWERAQEAVRAVRERKVTGKAVIDVTPAPAPVSAPAPAPVSASDLGAGAGAGPGA